MRKILTAKDMQRVDRSTTEKYGIPSIVLMENAAHATVKIIAEKLSGSVAKKSFLILCGKGNNGGDGAAIARILWFKGADVEVNLFGQVSETVGDARENFEILQKLCRVNSRSEARLKFAEIEDIHSWIETKKNFKTKPIIVDALFGTGLTRPIEKPLDAIFKSPFLLNKKDREFLVSVDIPSGLDSDSSKVIGKTIKADMTVTFTSPKLANVFPPASNFNGKLYIEQIGSPRVLIDDTPSQNYLSEKKDAKKWLHQTKFAKDSYKNKRGNTVLIVGSKRYSGAAVLAGNAAMQSGVGLVSVLVPKSAVNAVSERILPEVIVQGIQETSSGTAAEDAYDEIRKTCENADVIAIGSGLRSSEKSTQNLVRKIVQNRQTPVVVDADGLNALSPFNLEARNKPPLVLTPHRGEFLRLIGKQDKIEDWIISARQFAQKHRVILVLKGERTITAAPDGRIVVNPTGNSGVGKAGNGDNLTGIIAGFAAQAAKAEVDIFETVVAAVYTAGFAADLAEDKHGKRTMLASDVREYLAEAFKEIEGA